MRNSAENFEQYKSGGFIAKNIPFEKTPTAQKSPGFDIGEEMIKREQKENEAARQQLFELIDNFVDFLNSSENIKIIDGIEGEDFCLKLAEKIESYSQELAGKNIRKN